jgi:alkyldihydroxyacetonephosphate synthase
MLAKMGGVKRAEAKAPKSKAPGVGTLALRQVLRRPELMNHLLHSRRLLESRGKYEGEGPAQKWLKHRYSVSYRQAPMFATGAFVDTMEVAATWSKLGALYDGVRRAAGEHVFVMAHFSHAYPDGCCIYFSFAGSAASGGNAKGEWDRACQEKYDVTWRAALAAAVEAGGTIAHHHGVGRSKAPKMSAEIGAGVDVVRAMKRAFDPRGIMNPGNLLPEPHDGERA